MIRRGRYRLVVLLTLLLNLVSAGAFAQNALPEYVIKAGYLYHFGLLTDWPSNVLGANFRICYYGDDIASELSSINGKEVNGRPIHVYQLQGVSDVDDCHLLFFANTDLQESLQIIRAVQGRPILIVTDDEKLFNRGAAIFMRPEGQQLVFEIDNEIAKSAQLDISSRLLRLGR